MIEQCHVSLYPSFNDDETCGDDETYGNDETCCDGSYDGSYDGDDVLLPVLRGQQEQQQYQGQEQQYQGQEQQVPQEEQQKQETMTTCRIS